MTSAFYLLAFLYVATLGLILALELKRNGKLSADPIGVFAILTVLQCVLPGVFIFALLPNAIPGAASGVEIFDRIYSAASATDAFVVFGLTLGFLYFFYVGASTTHALIAERFDGRRAGISYEIRVLTRPLVLLLSIGFVISLVAFQSMGDSILERYTNMILLRSQDPSIDPTALSSNVLALLQSWSWLAIIAMFALRDRGGRGVAWWVCLSMLVAFSVMSVSRRALFLPILFSYLILVMKDDRWRVGTVALLGVIVLPLIAFGEELFGVLGYGGTLEVVEHTYSSAATGVVRTSSEIGISITESLGTISMIDLPPRFGIDHLLSIARRFPEGILGVDIEFPERVVRLSTAVFADPGEVDMPPGLMGQMWLDFRAFGPVIWGLAFGVQIGILQYLFVRTVRTLQSAAVYFVLIFIVALPINSGSFDFTFSVDIIAVVVILMLCVRIHRVHHVDREPA